MVGGPNREGIWRPRGGRMAWACVSLGRVRLWRSVEKPVANIKNFGLPVANRIQVGMAVAVASNQWKTVCRGFGSAWRWPTRPY